MKNAIKLILTGVALLTVAGCTPPPPPDPVVPKSAVVKSFNASPSAVAAGEKATLSWQVVDATSVSIATLDGTPVPLPDPKALAGSVDVEVDASTVYMLTARGEGGNDTAATSVAVQGEAPEALLAVSPAEIDAGQSATLIWNAPGATEVSITDSAGTTVYSGANASGSVSVVPTSSTTYTLSAGARTATTSLRVMPVVFGFGASPLAGMPGQPVTLSWKAAGADSLTLSAEGRGELATVTDGAQIADGSFQDTIPSDLPSTSSLVNYTLVAKQGALTVTQKLTVYVGVDPVITSYVIPSFGKSGGVFGVTWNAVNADSVQVEVDGTVVYVASSQAQVNVGSATISTPPESATVKIIATNARGGRTEKVATIAPVQTPVFVSFGATPTPVAQGGDPVTLSWEVTNARHVKLTRDDGTVITELTGTSAETGSLAVYPNRQTTYHLFADNTVGEAIPAQTVSVDVTTPAKLLFSPASVPNGTMVQLTGSTVQGGGAMRATSFAVKNAPGTAFVDISATGHALPVVADMDDEHVYASFPSTFSTRIMGAAVTAKGVSISTNGWFAFSDTKLSNGARPTSLPTTDLEPLAVAAFSDDLETGADTKILWQIDDVGGQQRLIVQWSNIYEYPYTQTPTKNLTFQAQIYGSGEVVVAFQSIVGYDSTDLGAIGLVNSNETGAVAVSTDQFVNGMHPAAGETYSFWCPLTLPWPLKAVTGRPYSVVQQVGTGEIEITTQPYTLPPGQFSIAEVNYNPAPGKEEWFEVVNNTATPIDLGGWDIDFGNGSVHPITGSVILPANGRLVFGQSADSTEASAGGPAVSYVYGTGFSMPDAGGKVSISMFGGAYASATWTSAGTAGTSMVVQPPTPNLLLVSTIANLTCPGAGTYGSGIQHGSPGQANPDCFHWRVHPGTTLFEPIALSGGTVISGMASTGNNSIDTVLKTLNLVSLGGRAVKVGTTFYGDATLPFTVSSNGFLTLLATTSNSGGNPTAPSTSAPNGVLSVFWDDLAANATSTSNPSGVYWKQVNPDGLPNSGDEYTLISWENWKRWASTYTSSLNFQIKFHEASGDFEYVYGTMTSSYAAYANGANATVWFESLDGNSALKVLADEPLLQPGTSYRFVYTP